MDKLSSLLFVLVYLNATHIQGKIIIKKKKISLACKRIFAKCIFMGFFKYRYSNNETRANKKKRKRKIHFEVIHVIPFSLYSAIISSNDCV